MFDGNVSITASILHAYLICAFTEEASSFRQDGHDVPDDLQDLHVQTVLWLIEKRDGLQGGERPALEALAAYITIVLLHITRDEGPYRCVRRYLEPKLRKGFPLLQEDSLEAKRAAIRQSLAAFKRLAREQPRDEPLEPLPPFLDLPRIARDLRDSIPHASMTTTFPGVFTSPQNTRS